MQPKTTILFLFFLMPVVATAQQVLPPEVRPARPVEEPKAPEGENAGQGTTVTLPVAPVAAPEDKKEPPTEPAPKPPAADKKPPASDKKPGPAAVKPASPVEGENASVAPVSALNAASLLPIGVPSFDVRMPEFDEVRLISRMRAQELTRIDDHQLDLRNMDLERYLPDGSIDYVVNVERGFYELSTGRLISSSPTRLRGKSMDLHGQGCVYSKDNDVIKILGKVTSYIYLQKGQLTQSKAKEPAEGSPPSVPPANP